MRVRLTGPAEHDLEAIGDWIGQDGAMRAARFVASLRQATATLAGHPRRYLAVLDIGAQAIRK